MKEREKKKRKRNEFIDVDFRLSPHLSTSVSVLWPVCELRSRADGQRGGEKLDRRKKERRKKAIEKERREPPGR